jgi:hypothetical protein
MSGRVECPAREVGGGTSSLRLVQAQRQVESTDMIRCRLTERRTNWEVTVLVAD